MIMSVGHPLAMKTHVYDAGGELVGRVQSFDTDKHQVVMVATKADGTVKLDDDFDIVLDTKVVTNWTYTIDGSVPKPI